jgi:hypothetical protein
MLYAMSGGRRILSFPQCLGHRCQRCPLCPINMGQYQVSQVDVPYYSGGQKNREVPAKNEVCRYRT